MNSPECFRKTVKVKHYVAVEGAGLVWVWLGTGEAPPAPNFEWMGLPPDQAYACGLELNSNWLQGVEATIDSSHIAILHQSHLASSSPCPRLSGMTMKYRAASSGWPGPKSKPPKFRRQNALR